MYVITIYFSCSTVSVLELKQMYLLHLKILLTFDLLFNGKASLFIAAVLSD